MHAHLTPYSIKNFRQSSQAIDVSYWEKDKGKDMNISIRDVENENEQST